MQDSAPAGGFPQTITYKRNLPKRGPSGALLITAAFGLMTYGFIEFSKDNAERRLDSLMVDNFVGKRLGLEYI
jgi:NADH dehydrogenase (ubiquinone) 1 alpha subcomplex subunit 13